MGCSSRSSNEPDASRSEPAIVARHVENARPAPTPLQTRTVEEVWTMTDKLLKGNRWLALVIVCLGDLMIVLDVTIVGVALPSIREDLGFSESSLAWVANAYLLTFGGFLLLAGRLGDLFGHRRLFLTGTALFT